MSVRKIAFTMYPVKDMARAKRFYGETLGLGAPSYDMMNAWVEWDLAGGCLALTTWAEGVEPAANAGGSIAFEVDDVDATVEKLGAAGATVKMAPFATPVCRMAVVVDPEGNALIIHRSHD